MEISATQRDSAPQPSRNDGWSSLHARLDALEQDAGARAVALAVYDTETRLVFRHHADRWFHAASTVKLPILLGVHSAIHDGRLALRSRLHVRNRFFSAADGETFHVRPERDANSVVHASIGRMMRVGDLVHHMIATSSNLATNLLLDFVGVDSVRRTLEELGLAGVDIRRGVEDDRAFELGINNRVTADGLVSLLRAIAEERAISPELSRLMLAVLHEQQFKDGIPARLPNDVRVAHKTGEISTVAHDAGIVYLPRRKPYVVAVLTEWDADGPAGRLATIADTSYAVYELIAAETTNG
jgi:beta-lactamase class A